MGRWMGCMGVITQKFMAIILLLSLLMGGTLSAAAAEMEVNIRRDLPQVTVHTGRGLVHIDREQDTQHKITGDFARTSRKCPPFCIQPMSPAEGVTTIGELELLDFLQDTDAVVIDSRTPKWYLDGTIPGARHLAYTVIAERLDQLGCEPDFDGWDCESAKRVALFCNGPWCGQSPTAIRAMIAEGYPADRIFYYRGGMQAWRMLGLTVVEGE